MEITSKELEQRIENGEKLIIDIWGTWCGPCKVMKPIFEKVSENNTSDVKMFTLDVDSNKELAMKYGIRSIPTILVFKDKEIVNSKIGFLMEKQILELLDSLN
jgi:thioredoxin 1